MSITNISTDIKHEVLLRLLQNGESFIDACSKSGLQIKAAKAFLTIQKTIVE